MDVGIILATFVLGFLAARLGLPPLVGYLTAGFALHALGYENTGAIEFIAELGILFLLFGIGLKLRPATLIRKEVWAVAGLHMSFTTGLLGMFFLGLGSLGLPLATGLTPSGAVLVGFIFSFSSTVFAVKALEERGEAESLSGRIAIGILVVQDLFAVVFLTLSSGSPPSLWAIPVVGLVLAGRPVFGWFLKHSGHGELQILLGLALAVGVGAEVFDRVGLKPDLGALIVGMTLAGHPQANELFQRLLGLKDVLLIGFFLSIGLGGTPGSGAIAVAGLVLLFAVAKTAGFLILLSRFHLRARTALYASLSLGSYSEFGLIVAAVGVDRGLLDQEWLSAGAVAVAASFVLAAPANSSRYAIYGRWSRWLVSLEQHPIQPEDALVEPTAGRIVVFGMGRVGQGAYDEFVDRHGEVVLGVERRNEVIAENLAMGRRVLRGDALDRDFWERLRLKPGFELAVLAMNDHEANLEAARRVRDFLPEIRIAATATYPDEVGELERAGVDVARNLYGEAGQGLADDASDLLETKSPEL